MEKYHIGQEILKEVKAKFPSVAAFARELQVELCHIRDIRKDKSRHRLAAESIKAAGQRLLPRILGEMSERRSSGGRQADGRKQHLATLARR